VLDKNNSRKIVVGQIHNTLVLFDEGVRYCFVFVLIIK